MWGIASVTDKKYSCEQALLVSYANFLKRDYQMILADSWGFDYYEKGSIGEKLSPGYRKSRYSNYEKFHGIKVNNANISSKDELKEFVYSNINNTPIMIDFDTYYCEWNKLYQKKSVFHRLLIIGVFDKNKFACIDHYSSNYVIVDISTLPAWSGAASTFTVNELYDVPQFVFLDEIQKHSRYLIETSMLDKLREFFLDLQFNTKVSYGEYDANSPSESLILINLDRIINQRCCFKEYLEYLIRIGILKEKNRDLIEIFNEMSLKYNLLKMVIAKELVQKRLDNKTRLIEEVWNLEHKALQAFSYVSSNL